MASIGGYVQTAHTTQYDGSTYYRANCTPTSGANGARAATAGRVSLSGAQMRNFIPRSQETNPATPGWSLEDLDAACVKIGVGFEVRTGKGWTAFIDALNHGLYAVLQGDSDRFSGATCSGDYDGDHAIGVHPATQLVGGLRQHWIDDPICPTGRWEYDYILHNYAAKLYATIRFGVFTTAVQKAVVAPVVVTLRGGGVKLSPSQLKRISVPAGTKAVIRKIPSSTGYRMGLLSNGQLFRAYQVTTSGQLLAGSRRWFGDATGTRWLHVTAF